MLTDFDFEVGLVQAGYFWELIFFLGRLLIAYFLFLAVNLDSMYNRNCVLKKWLKFGYKIIHVK